MNILIICTWFPPDSAVAAVRPYMLAKYLTKFGHKVTVLTSGDCWRQPCDDYDLDVGFKIKTYDHPIKPDYLKHELNDSSEKSVANKVKSSIEVFNKSLYNFLKVIYNITPLPLIKTIRPCKDRCNKIVRFLDQMSDEKYDIVFSTYGELENIWAGQYAAEKFHAKWVLDFRDPVNRNMPRTFLKNCYGYYCEHKYVPLANRVTSVSEGLTKQLTKSNPKENVVTLYNGYDSDSDESYPVNADKDCFSICYTGTMYEESICALSSLAVALSQCFDEGRLDRKKVKFKYAGNASATVRNIFSENGIEDIFEDHGYVSRGESHQIQQNSDIFLVLSWNTKTAQGVLTGKFYEGIRAGRPILSVIWGDTPNSELYMLNKKYHYGFCYEDCRKNKMYPMLIKYLEGMYNRKFSDKGIVYHPDSGLVNAFHYKNITRKFESLCEELTRK